MRVHSRRSLLVGLGALAATPWLAIAADRPGVQPLRLPLRLRELVNHIGISVTDVTRSATFYSHLFEGHGILGQDTPALRYEIDFHPGALSIGALRAAAGAGGVRPFIDHFCVAAQPFDAAAWRARLDEEKVRYFAHGTFVEIGDIPVQLIGGRSPGTHKPPAGGGFKPMPPLYTGRPLVTAHGFERVTLHVADLESSSALITRLFGLVARKSASGEVFYRVGAIRLALRLTAPAEKPGIASYAIRVERFDPARLTDALGELGATVHPPQGSIRGVLRFADPDGIECELRPA
ncbi:MAG TPA: hypothetical protein VMU67_09240 [Steroidobacteraceae bacterium]|nr:hypothetical protein [Steroidobacteraceae bacterium]